MSKKGHYKTSAAKAAAGKSVTKPEERVGTKDVQGEDAAAVSEGVYRKVGQEVLSGNLDPVSWAKALTESGAGKDEALTVYARIRTEELARRVGPEVQKEKKLECRVAQAYRDTKDVPPLGPICFQRSGGLRRAMDAIFWHCVAGVAAVGCLMAAQILWPELRVHLTVNRLVVIVLAFQLFPIIGWVSAGRNGFYSVLNYSEAAHMSACVAIAASVLIGGYLLIGGEGTEVVFRSDEPPGSLLVVMPEDQLVKPVVHAQALPTKPVKLVAAEE